MDGHFVGKRIILNRTNFSFFFDRVISNSVAWVSE